MVFIALKMARKYMQGYCRTPGLLQGEVVQWHKTRDKIKFYFFGQASIHRKGFRPFLNVRLRLAHVKSGIESAIEFK